MIILIHTSKTMRPPADETDPTLSRPLLIEKANDLAAYAKTLDREAIKKTMRISDTLADTTHGLLQHWTDDPSKQRAAVDSFLGDIYSGLQVSSWSETDRQYANEHLRILSGLYGILRPLDGIYPYRLEMGYTLPDPAFKNLYTFWGISIVDSLPADEMIVDLSAVEYGKTVTKYADPDRIITPRFLTVSPKTGEPTFVVVHAKIARGAFANWMIQNQIESLEKLKEFKDLGYEYKKELSTAESPVFVCQKFGGLGLSVRLT